MTTIEIMQRRKEAPSKEEAEVDGGPIDQECGFPLL